MNEANAMNVTKNIGAAKIGPAAPGVIVTLHEPLDQVAVERVDHEPGPPIAGEHPEEDQQAVPKVLEVGALVDELAVLHLAKQVHAEDAVDEHEQEQQASNVTHGDERVDERREEGTEPRRVLGSLKSLPRRNVRSKVAPGPIS